jgi:hypothetical protein
MLAGLLINCVEHNEDNRDQLASCGGGEGTVKFLVHLFLSKIQEDRSVAQCARESSLPWAGVLCVSALHQSQPLHLCAPCFFAFASCLCSLAALTVH